MLHAGSVLLRWLREQESRQQIRSVFSSYIAPAVMERLLEHPENVRLGGVSQPVTMLFSDIRGFTTLSETMTDVELVTQLNEYFERMVDCVNRYRGTLHKYIGDAVMAAWGDVAPETPAIDAARAARSALAMRAELIVLNQTWAAQDRKQFRIGIGLNHGTVTVGNIGAPQRREFTLIGDPVNTAARLEGVTKEYQTDIAVGESVEALIRDEFLMRTLGLIVVKGKTRGLRVFELLDDRKNPAGSWPPEWVARHEAAMEKYLAGDFAPALAQFEACLGQRPGDYVCELYIGFCRELIEHPPGQWDGLHVMKTK
jgi:adenylate cyclase